ncbi:MAG: phosphate signaling complex protein PhoU [Gammaproteobacteria bacterium]|nr:phosphate signaling complex protein PhoU [Gammaproteobacteria bacterium]
MDMLQTPHITRVYDLELQQARGMVMTMGGLVEQQLDSALRALFEHNIELGQSAATGDYKVNEFEVRIDELVVQTIALRQPAANDLRFLFTVIKIITDLERIGDKAEKIGRLSLTLAPLLNGFAFIEDMRSMGTQVQKMLHEALDAFARMDAEAAARISAEDLEVNKTYKKALAELMQHMSQNPNTIDVSLDILWCLRAIERIGDHVTNLCEYVIFLVKGKDVRHLSREDMLREVTS